MAAKSDWTEEKVAELRRLWDEGHSTAEIGRRLGYSKNAICGKANRLGLPLRENPVADRWAGRAQNPRRAPRCGVQGSLVTPAAEPPRERPAAPPEPTAGDGVVEAAARGGSAASTPSEVPAPPPPEVEAPVPVEALMDPREVAEAEASWRERREDRRDEGCRWPTGGPQGGWRFCGAPRCFREGMEAPCSYCVEHAKRAFVFPRLRSAA